MSRNATFPSGSFFRFLPTQPQPLTFSFPFSEERWWQEGGCRDHGKMFCPKPNNNHPLGGISLCRSWDSDYWSHGLLRCCCLAIGIISHKIFYISMVFQSVLFLVVYHVEGRNRSHGSILWIQIMLKLVSHKIGKMLPPMNPIFDL